MKTANLSPLFKRAALTAAALTALAFAGAAAGEALHKYTPAKTGTSLQVLGSSTLHDWKIESAQLEGTLNVCIADLEAGTWGADRLPVVDVKVRAESLKSDKTAMDKVTFKSLRTGEFPEITYQLTEAGAPKSVGEGKWIVPARGNMTVAGAKKEIKMPFTVTKDGAALVITGRIAMKMTDFGIKPPTALMGAIKSADEITVIITWRLEPAA